jgi:hypothetical protein
MVSDRTRPGTAWYRRMTSWAVWMTALVVLMSLFPLFQNAALTTNGYEVEKLRARRGHLEQVTFLLEADAARLQSLDRVDREARERLKMVPAGTVRFLSTPHAPARVSDARALPPSHVKQAEAPQPAPDLSILPADLLALVTAGGR